MMLKTLLGSLALLALPAAAEAAIVVDQSALVRTDAGFAATTAGVTSRPGQPTNGINTLVQTITAGVAGRLTSIDLQAYRAGGTGFIDFRLYAGDGRQPTAAILFSRGYALTDLPTSVDVRNGALFSFDVTAAAYDVTPGQLFSVYIGPANPLDEIGRIALVNGSTTSTGSPPMIDYNQYAGGDLSVSANGVTYRPSSGDGGFRTLVDTGFVAAAPEPASWVAMLLGFGIVGAALRRRTMRIARIRIQS